MFQRSCRAGLVVGLWACLAVSAFSASPQVPVAVRQAMQDRDYPAALAALDAALEQQQEDRDYLTFLKGRALYFQQQYDAAAAEFDRLAADYPESAWRRHSEFAKAVSLARKGDFRGAEQIYREQAQFLLSLDRKQEIADIYLEFADAYFEPKAADQTPDYAKALEFFQMALRVGPPIEQRIQLQLKIARCYFELPDHGQAIEHLNQFISAHPDHPLQVEARYLLGASQLATQQYDESRRTWQDLLEIFPDDASPRIAEAAFRLAETYQLPNPPSSFQLTLGVAALNRFLDRFAEHELAGDAYMLMARSYTSQAQMEDAVEVLQKFLAEPRYANRSQIPQARVLLGQSFKAQAKFDQALATWREFLQQHPTDAAWSTVQQELIDTEYAKAATAFEDKKYEEARQLWGEFQVKYPLDDRNRLISLWLGDMLHEEEEYDEAIEQWRRLVSKYPDTEEASQAQFKIAYVMEDKLHQFEAAIEQYRKLTWGGYQSAAQQRVAALTAKSLELSTQRIFRTAETPQVRLLTRNIPNVTVRVFTIDLESYFRKMHLTSGVESLDISLIDADNIFEFEVPEYQPHQLFESLVDVPLPDAGGVLAITVSSETLEATTLLLQTDLDIIVKSSRNEVFVFAQNMKSQQPWSGARVLVSDGDEVFAQGTTDEQGVFRHTLDPSTDMQSVRVLATDERHFASNLLDLQGLGVAQGLAPKGYVYTDRGTYRQGQLVHLRGLIRHVADDVYRIIEDKAYRLEVYDPRNRLIFEDQVKLNRFGSFFSHFVLPEDSPQGTYRVVVHDRDQESHAGQFQVRDYNLEPIQLEIDAPRTVYYRGEEIEGTIRVSYYYGAPLAGRTVRYRLPGGRVYTAQTNDQGEVAFHLPTRDYQQSQPLALSVTLPDRGLQTTRVFQLATQAFQLEVSTGRPLYLNGETFEVQVKAVDPEGQPSQQTLKLAVLKRTQVDRRVGEVRVQELDLETGADGIGRVTVQIPEGGNYVLRAVGSDRFQNSISGQAVIDVSDDSDTTRLRILADQHTFKVGDQTKVRVHWREAPALALVTFEGARILDYRLVQLQQGINEIDVQMAQSLAPNFNLGVAVMTNPAKDKGPQTAFHESFSSFTVVRQLNVAIERLADGPVKPGDKVQVTITTTDPQGKPVSAEVGLALVEQSLLDRFPDPAPDIAEFFQGAARQMAMRTTSSIVFQYQPPTRAIDARLLAEADRLEIEALENEAIQTLRNDPGSWGNARNTWQSLSEFESDAERQSIVADNVMGRPSRGFAQQQGQLLGQANGVDYFGMQNYELAQNRAGQMAVQPLFDTDSNGWAKFAGNASALRDYMQAGNSVQLLGLDGSFTCASLSDEELDPARFASQLDQWQRSGAILLPARFAQETGYWNPSIETDEQGTATIEITLPDRSTGWTMVARAISLEALAGSHTQSFTAKKDLFAELKVPATLTHADTAEVVATIHNDSIEGQELQLEMKVTIADKTNVERRTVPMAEKGIQEVTFKQAFLLPEALQQQGTLSHAQFELTVTAGDHRDVVRRTVPLRPRGLPVFSVQGGTATADTTVVLEPTLPVRGASLEILIGPSVQQSLLDAVLAPPTWCQVELNRVSSSSESLTSDLMASLALQKLLGVSSESERPEAFALDQRIRAAVGSLTAQQEDSGGWSWTGRPGRNDRYHSARVVWALSLARDAGYRIGDEVLTKATHYLQQELVQSPVTDYETKAVLLQGLTAAGQADFTLANQLYRNRQALSSPALAHLALTFAKMDRAPTAAELLVIVAERGWDRSALGRTALPWCQSVVELRALYTLALHHVAPTDGQLKSHVDWLISQRNGFRWTPDKATGPAMQAICGWYAGGGGQGEKYRLRVVVNDRLVEELEIEPSGGSRTLQVDPQLLQDGKQRVRFQLVGRAHYTYQVVLGGFAQGDQLKNTTDQWRVERFYLPAPLEVDGREVPQGFANVRAPYQPFRNELSQLPVGTMGRVELQVRRYNLPANTPENRLPYLVVVEPLPAGASVMESSIEGEFERYELASDRITFYLGNQYHANIRYSLYGYLAGAYHVSPTVVRDAYQVDQIAVVQEKQLTVLPADAKSADPYRLTPVELFELGRIHFEKGELAQAATHLRQLVNDWNLDAEPFKETVRMLLDVSLHEEAAAEVVRYFEIIVEKYPDLEVPFAKLLLIGDAYDRIGEYERSYLVFRAAVEASFLRESQAAGFLQQQGELLRSIDVMSSLLQQYPPEPYQAIGTYALAQNIYAKAPEAASDPKLRRKNISRIDLIREAWLRLDLFLTAYPEDPAADEASFSLANALLDMQQYQRAIDACQRFVERFPESKFLDSFWYITGYCHFALGQHEQALQMCQKVAEARRTDPHSGRDEESVNKWRAIYILGQIYHSLGQAEKAIQQYRRVEERFVDASQAIEYFARKDVQLPEVTTLLPGDPVKVTLTFRNVPQCETTVYRIDLMKFGLLRGNLSGFREINLAGIRPQHQAITRLGDGKDFRDRETAIELPIEREGAYLVVCRADNLYASGLVLISPLELRIQEELSSGRVRATVRNVVDDQYVKDVHVKVIGSYNEDFIAGRTDLRGVFVADGIQGQAMVIAEGDDGRYAFFRGIAHLGPPVAQQDEANAAAGEKAPADGEAGETELLKGLKGGNYDIQQRNQKQLDQYYNNSIDAGIGGGFGGGIF